MKLFISIFFILLTNSLSSQSDYNKAYTLYIFLLEDCPICIQYTDDLNNLYNTFGNDIHFQGLFPNFYSKSKGIEEYKNKFDIKFDLKTDHYKTITNKLGATITPEVFLVNNETQEILYQGNIDNGYYKAGRRRNSGVVKNLKNALISLSKNEIIEVAKTYPIGCFINFNDNLVKK